MSNMYESSSKWFLCELHSDSPILCELTQIYYTALASRNNHPPQATLLDQGPSTWTLLAWSPEMIPQMQVDSVSGYLVNPSYKVESCKYSTWEKMRLGLTDVPNQAQGALARQHSKPPEQGQTFQGGLTISRKVQSGHRGLGQGPRLLKCKDSIAPDAAINTFNYHTSRMTHCTYTYNLYLLVDVELNLIHMCFLTLHQMARCFTI